jgi:thiamine-phosphate pyrophosphorylase
MPKREGLVTRQETLTQRLRDARLYVITSAAHPDGRDLVAQSEAALRGGADILQLRHKDLKDSALLSIARELRRLTDRYGALFIVNDRPGVALLVDADGVHVGQDDLSVDAVRRVMGPGKLVGVSTHAPEQARKALEDGADYIGVGPVFPTPTKAGRPAVTLEYVRQVVQMNLPIPFFAIGGIDETNIPEVMAAGARRVAVVRAVMASQDPEESARIIKKTVYSVGL